MHSAPRPQAIPVGHVDFGDLRGIAPLDPDYGFGGGKPVDRVSIEDFLDRRRADVTGCVLEVEDRAYTTRFGHDVEHSDVLHVSADHAGATVVADLADAPQLPSARYDCIVLTQTLQYIFDLPAAVATLYRILKPGRTVLATLPGLSRISAPQWSATWHWMFTSRSARRLFADAFGADRVDVEGFGNLLVATAFLHGLASEDLNPGRPRPAGRGLRDRHRRSGPPLTDRFATARACPR